MSDSVISAEKKQAKIAISTALISIAAGLLPIVAALIIFVFDSRITGCGFWVATLLSTVAYISSIFFGGWGIEKTAGGARHQYLLIATVLLALAFLGTGKKEEKLDPELAIWRQEALKSREEIGKLNAQVEDLRVKILTQPMQNTLPRSN